MKNERFINGAEIVRNPNTIKFDVLLKRRSNTFCVPMLAKRQGIMRNFSLDWVLKWNPLWSRKDKKVTPDECCCSSVLHGSFPALSFSTRSPAKTPFFRGLRGLPQKPVTDLGLSTEAKGIRSDNSSKIIWFNPWSADRFRIINPS